MTKEQIQCVKDGLSRQKLYIALGCIEELEKENEELRTKNKEQSISSMCFGCKNKSKWELDE